MVEIYGPESSGKTTVALHCVAEAQKAGGVAAFIDAEHALYPAETNYYFYALNADGIHHFSETYYEHQNFLAELAGKTQPDEEQTDAPADGEETTDTENQTDGQT